MAFGEYVRDGRADFLDGSVVITLLQLPGINCALYTPLR